MAAVVVVMVVSSVLALDLSWPCQGLGQVVPFQVKLLEPDLWVMLLCQRGSGASYWTEIHNWLTRENEVYRHIRKEVEIE